MRLIRLMLIVSVFLAAYVALLVMVRIPYAWLVTVAFAVWLLCKRTYQLSAYGTTAGPKLLP
jgi:hypothetical protein